MTDYIYSLPFTKGFLDRCPECRHSAFPGGGKTDYAKVLLDTHVYLNEKVHSRVELRAAVVDPGTFLTDHGPDHIKTVMQRAQFLIAKSAWAKNSRRDEETFESCLTPYEEFLLLMAIHFHDVGNTYGREGHEKRIADMMKNVTVLGDFDRFELAAIARIAACHGGTIDGNFDTISYLSEKETFGAGEYRPRLIAAVLRLADELAEERSRADTFALKDPTKLPGQSLGFHKYAAALASVNLDPINHAINLKYRVDKEVAETKFDIKGKNGYLLDYIYERTLKTYRELIYCNKFTQDLQCKYNEVWVSIEVYCEPLDFQPKKTIAYKIGDIGYPGDQHGTLNSLAPTFASAPTGEALAAFLTEACHYVGT